MATEMNIYVEVVDTTTTRVYPSTRDYRGDKHVNKIDIYTNNEDHVRAIAKSINAIWDDGIIPHIDFKKIEKNFKIGKEEIINQWNAFL